MHKTTVITVVAGLLVVCLIWALSGSSQIAQTAKQDEPVQRRQTPCPSEIEREILEEVIQPGTVIIKEITQLVDCAFDPSTETTRDMLQGIAVPKSSQFSFLSAWLKPEAGKQKWSTYFNVKASPYFYHSAIWTSS